MCCLSGGRPPQTPPTPRLHSAWQQQPQPQSQSQLRPHSGASLRPLWQPTELCTSLFQRAGAYRVERILHMLPGRGGASGAPMGRIELCARAGGASMCVRRCPLGGEREVWGCGGGAPGDTRRRTRFRRSLCCVEARSEVFVSWESRHSA